MIIQKDTSEDVPREFLDFVQMVSDGENLFGWKLIIWNLKGEAECITDMKLINMAVRPGYDPKRIIEEMKAWFLHEVAHATFEMKGGSSGDSIWHRKLWRVEFDRLLNYYIPNVTQRTILWVKELE